MTDFATLDVQINTDGGNATREIDAAARAMGKAQANADRLAASSQKAGSGMGAAAAQARALGREQGKATAQSANMAAQFNDIGTMMLSGQSPFMLAVQQGTQVNQVLAQMGGGTKALKGALAGLTAAFNPMNLAVIGLIAGVAAGTQAIMRFAGAGKDVEDALRDAEDAVAAFGKSTKSATLDFAGMVKEFGSGSAELQASLKRIALNDQAAAFDALRESAKALRKEAAGGALSPQLQNLAESFNIGGLGGDNFLPKVFEDNIDTIKGLLADLKTMSKSDDVDEMAAAWRRVNEAFEANVASAGPMTASQRELSTSLNTYRVTLEALGVEMGKLASTGPTLADMVSRFAGLKDTLTNSGVDLFKDALKLSAQGAYDLAQHLGAASLKGRDLQVAMMAVAPTVAGIAGDIETQTRALEIQTKAILTGQDARILSWKSEIDALRDALIAQDAYTGQLDGAYSALARYTQALDANNSALGSNASSAKTAAGALSEYAAAARAASAADVALSSRPMGVSGPSLAESASQTQAASFYNDSAYSGVIAKLKQEAVDAAGTVETAFRSTIGVIEDFSSNTKNSLLNLLTGGGSKQAYWDDFERLAIDSWRTVMDASFSANSPAMRSLESGLSSAISNAVGGSVAQTLRMIDVRSKLISRTYGTFNHTTLQKSPEQYEKDVRQTLAGVFSSQRSLVDVKLIGRLAKQSSLSLAKTIQTVTTVTRNTAASIFGSSGGVQRTSGGAGTKLALNQDNLIWGPNSVTGATLGGSGGSTTTTRTVTQTVTRAQREASRALNLVTTSIRDNIRVFSDAIGGESQRINKVVHKFTVSLGSNATVKDAQKALADNVEAYANKLAKAVLSGRNSLRRAGEAWTDTLDRLAKDFWKAYGTLKMLGMQMLDNTVAGANRSSKLIELFGGAGKFQSAASEFFSVAFSDAQQKQKISAYLTESLASVGINALPQTREEYAQLVGAQNLNTKAGREMYKMLVSLAGMFDQVLPQFEAAGDSITAMALEGLDDLIDRAKDAERNFRQLAESLSGMARELRGIGNSPERTFQILRDQFDRLFTRSLTGDLDALNQIGGVAQDYSAAFASRARSSGEQAFFNAVLANKLDTLSGVAQTGAELSAYQVENLEKLEEQIKTATITNELVQKVVDAVGGLDANMWSALGALYKAQTGEALTAGNTPNAVTLPATQEGQIAYLTNVLQSAASGTTNAVALGAGGAVATGGSTASGSNEIARMRREMSYQMKRANNYARRNVKFNKKSYNVLRGWDENGIVTI